MAERIRIAVVDAHPLFRQGVVQTMSGTNLAVVAEGESLDDALRIAQQSKLDVLLLDISIPGDGAEAIEKIRRMRSNAKVVILTASDDEEDVADALRAGAQGYVLKGVSGAELVAAIRAIHRGEPYITQALACRLLTQTRGKPLASEKATEQLSLTVREQQILGHLTEGLTNQEIAVKLGVNVRTIKHYLTQVFRKMRVRNRVEAIVEAQKLRLEFNSHAPT